MIRYALKCDRGHAFESWFKSAEAFDVLRKAGHLNCTECGSAAEVKAALAQMRKHVEANSTYVGGNFAKEARAMHLGDAPERAIHGEAKPAEAKALIEDGVPVMPLPFMPKSKVN